MQLSCLQLSFLKAETSQSSSSSHLELNPLEGASALPPDEPHCCLIASEIPEGPGRHVQTRCPGLPFPFSPCACHRLGHQQHPTASSHISPAYKKQNIKLTKEGRFPELRSRFFFFFCYRVRSRMVKWRSETASFQSREKFIPRCPRRTHRDLGHRGKEARQQE